MLLLTPDSSSFFIFRFRQQCAASLSVLLCRCRDFGVQLLRAVTKGGGEVGRLEELLIFVDTVLRLLFLHLLPGGNYQRRSFALDLLQVFVGIFFTPGSGKGPTADPSPLVEHAKENGQMELVTKNHRELLLLLLEDHMSDVVEKSAELLGGCFRPALVEERQLVTRMLELVRSGKEARCHSGAVLASLLHRWGVRMEEGDLQPQGLNPTSQQGVVLNGLPSQSSEVETATVLSDHLSSQESTLNAESVLEAAPLEPTEPPPGLPSQLLSLARATLLRCHSDFLSCAWKSPLHGTLAAIRRCLSSPVDRAQAELLLALLEDTVALMLKVLSGKMAEDDASNNPDFQQMARSIDQLVAREDDEQEEVGIPEDHQRVLSMAWHCLKEASLLTTHLGQVTGLTQEQVARCAQLFLGIASTCRHKGAMEAANLACGNFCSNLLIRGGPPEHRAVPEAMLQSALGRLTTSWARSSFTRRSAGLPGLVCRLVAAEGGGKQRQLLSLAVDTLLKCCKKEVEKDDDIKGGAEDSPASHALHVLRSLVQDAVVARDLGPHLLEISRTTLDSFTSPSWSERNAALQLFGALAPRLVGQVKVRGEESGLNRQEVGQVAAQVPGLLELLLTRLEQANDGQLADPALLPILTILARLESRGTSSPLTPRIAAAALLHRSHKVARVRSLVAKVLALHSPGLTTEQVLASALASQRAGEGRDTNMLHCQVVLARELVSRGGYTSEEKVARLLLEVDCLSTCWVVRAVVVRVGQELRKGRVVERQEIEDQQVEDVIVLDESLEMEDPEEVSGVVKMQETEETSEEQEFQDEEAGEKQCGSWEPGLALWQELTTSQESSTPELEPSSTSSWQTALLHLEASPSATRAMALLTSLLSSPQCSSPLLARLLRLLLANLSQANHQTPVEYALMPQPELLLEVVDLLQEEQAALSLHGTTVSGLVLRLRAASLATMLLQEDWTWFFGEQSQYVSHVVETSEQVVEQCGPSAPEEARLEAARALGSFLPVFLAREVEDMALVLQYAWVNLVNAGLVLLQVEGVVL